MKNYYEIETHVTEKIGLVWFYDISTIVGYLMPSSVFTYIQTIYDL